MHRRTDRALTGTTDHPVLTFRRSYRASPQNLRGALTDSDRLRGWFGEVGGSPAAVGDAFTAQLGDDPDDVATGRVLDCEAELVRVSWRWQDEEESVLTARIIPSHDGTTELRLDHSLGDQRLVQGYGGGWEQLLRSLARTLGSAAEDAPDDEALERDAAESWHGLAAAPIEIEMVLPAGIGRVWDAVATAEGLRSWWWSQWSDVMIVADVRPGGTYSITAPRIGVELTGTYLEVEEEAHLAYTWVWREESGTSLDEAVDLRLEATGEGTTRLRLRHTGPWQEGDQLSANYREGWIDTLGRLEALLGR